MKNMKPGKIAIVIFLTVLIWVWADTAQHEQIEKAAEINIDSSATPELWVTFVGLDGPSADDVRITFSGPHSMITDFDRDWKGQRLEFEFDAKQQDVAESGVWTQQLQSFLEDQPLIRRLGLKVLSVEPASLKVGVERLVKRPVKVQALGDEGVILTKASIDPAEMDMYVLPGWGNDVRAKVLMTDAEILQARTEAIVKRPFLEFPDGQIRQADQPVTVRMPAETEKLQDRVVTGTTLAIAMSPALQGRYQVQIKNLAEVMSAIAIRATPEAWQAYEQQKRPTMTLYIYEDDTKNTEVQRREVVYNFPQRYVRSGDIELKNAQPRTVQFQIFPMEKQQ